MPEQVTELRGLPLRTGPARSGWRAPPGTPSSRQRPGPALSRAAALAPALLSSSAGPRQGPGAQVSAAASPEGAARSQRLS